MESEVYMGYRILMYLITVFFMGRWSLRCTRRASRMIVLTAGGIMILMNEAISAFLAPIFVVLASTLLCIFGIVLVFGLLTGHSLGSIFQHFNILRRK